MTVRMDGSERAGRKTCDGRVGRILRGQTAAVKDLGRSLEERL